MPRVSRRRLRRRFFANASLLEGSIRRASTSLSDVAFLDLPRRREVRCARKSHLHVRHVVRLACGFHSTTVTPGLSFTWTDAFHSRSVPSYATWWVHEEKQASKCINRNEKTTRCLFGHQLGHAHAFRVGGMSMAREVRWSMGAFSWHPCMQGWCLVRKVVTFGGRSEVQADVQGIHRLHVAMWGHVCKEDETNFAHVALSTDVTPILSVSFVFRRLACPPRPPSMLVWHLGTRCALPMQASKVDGSPHPLNFRLTSLGSSLWLSRLPRDLPTLHPPSSLPASRPRFELSWG